MSVRPQDRKTPWTPAQDAILLAEYVTTRDLPGLAEKIGRTIRAAYKRAGQLNLRRPRTDRTVASRYSILALVLAARPAGMRAADLGHPNINAAGAVMCRLVALGHVHRATLGCRTVHYFTTRQAAERFVAAHMPARVAKQAKDDPKRQARVGWESDAPMVITAKTIYTYAPAPPAQVFRTNTFK